MKEIWKTIQKLDLSNIRKKFLSKKNFWWKLKNDAKKIEEEYKQFLYVIAVSDTPIVPHNQDIDDFWHEHILHTQKYEQDCITVFGKFIHHNPTENNQEAVKKTKKAYKKAFTGIKKRRSTNNTIHYYDDSGNLLDEIVVNHYLLDAIACNAIQANEPIQHDIVACNAMPDGNYSSSNETLSAETGHSEPSCSSSSSSCSSSSCSSSSCSSSSGD